MRPIRGPTYFLLGSGREREEARNQNPLGRVRHGAGVRESHRGVHARAHARGRPRGEHPGRGGKVVPCAVVQAGRRCVGGRNKAEGRGMYGGPIS